MYPQIRNFVKSCIICQKNASLPKQPQRKLQPIQPPDRPWRHIGMDLPETSDGYKHVLVTGYLSKYVVARPLKTKTTTEVTQELQDILLELGLLISYNMIRGRRSLPRHFRSFVNN